MYGMIHRAAREMVLSGGDESNWKRILDQSGLKDEDFVSGLAYADQITFKLINAVAAELNLSLEETLVRFGRYWIVFAGASAFSPLMAMAGDDMFEFCGNLDRMHANIKVSLPGVDVPSFQVRETDETSMRIAYFSSRTGLEPFVTGLFEGLLLRFGQTGQVRCLGPEDGAVDFSITLDA